MDDYSEVETYLKKAADYCMSSKFKKSHQVYKVGLKYFSDKDRNAVYEIIMSEVKQYFYMEDKFNDGMATFLLGINVIDDITDKLLFYRSLYGLYFFNKYYEKELSGIYLQWFTGLSECIKNSDITKFTNIMLEMETNNTLKSHEITILLSIKNRIKDNLSK